jgi:hypothetical protein
VDTHSKPPSPVSPTDLVCQLGSADQWHGTQSPNHREIYEFYTWSACVAQFSSTKHSTELPNNKEMLSHYQQRQLPIMNFAIENEFLFGDYFPMKINRKK